MYHESPDFWKNLLITGLKEDGWPWDWTTLGSQRKASGKLRAQVIAKSEGIWAAEDLVKALIQVSGLGVKSKVTDGEKLNPKDLILEIEGPAMDLLAYERPFLNLAAYVSGIATTTQRYVSRVRHACPQRPPRVTLTRKTLPGYRDLAIHGVRVGGGFPHRVSLSGGILIKENHIALAGSITEAIQGIRETAPHGLKIEVEVKFEKELKEALEAKVDGVLLDNFTPEQVERALEVIKKISDPVFVEVSGGLNEANIADYAQEGVDVLSVGALTHSLKALDLSLLVR
jgi:nicotinate-nucleotide pyrophosphorylase (carboxylating)